jgi:hypothetical protein
VQQSFLAQSVFVVFPGFSIDYEIQWQIEKMVDVAHTQFATGRTFKGTCICAKTFTREKSQK